MRRMLFALAAVLLSVPATHAGVLDQSQDTATPGSYFAVGATTPAVQSVIGQVFTAGLDGYLDQVEVYVENDSAHPVTGGLLLSVQTVTPEGLPSGREIAGDSIEVCSATLVTHCVPAAGSPGWVQFSVPPALVNAGSRYALVLRAGGGGYLRWYNYVGPSIYPGGYAAGTTGSGWFAIDYDDATFRTYVRPPVLDQSQTAFNAYKIVGPPMAESFKPGVTGYLRRVSVLIENQTSTGPVRFSLHVFDEINPSIFTLGPEIAVAMIPAANIPPAGSPGWVDVTLDYPWLEAGREYRIKLDMPSTGTIRWYDYEDATKFPWPRMEMRWTYSVLGMGYWDELPFHDTTFQTYMLRPAVRFTSPPPRVVSPCINRVCPETKGGLTPADYVDGIKAHFLFKEKLNGTVVGNFSFTDDWPDGISFEDCTTESDTCRLQVTTFLCTGPNAMTVAGSFQRAGDKYATSYELNLTGTGKGSGTIRLEIPRKTYTFTHDRIVEVRCP